MALDLHKIALQIDQAASNLNSLEADRSYKLELALNTISTARPESLEEKRLLSRATFLIAGINGSVLGRYPCTDIPENYTVLAVDGSHIDIDRHLAMQCYLINIGKVRIQYGTRPSAWLDSEPQLYNGENSMRIIEPGGNRTQSLEGHLLGVLRAVEELQSLVTLAKESDPSIPTLALIDGSLILWGLVGQSYPDFVRKVLLEEKFLLAMEELREMSQTRQLALASYVSLPRSTDVINSLRLDSRQCPYEAANCDVHCGTVKTGQRPCDTISEVTDRDVFGSLLGYLERSDEFSNTSSIVERYYGKHQVHFYYMNVGSEIARVEIPNWVAENSELLELTHTILVDQSRKGHGYPVAISEAHEQAVVTTGDREEFRIMVEGALQRRHLPVYTSQKDHSKRLKWL